MHEKDSVINAQPEKPDHLSQEAWMSVDVPEMTDEEFARAVPLKTAQPDLYAEWKKGRSRPIINGQTRKHIGFRWSAEVVDALKASGKDYNARAEMVLRDALAKGLL